ncbi:hypothetical protein FRC10_006130 [Ceratobasidium sp. 414]|nr:hypothetical protein FRC10_006130 [Ceratobasidium sp. 414]
MAEGANLRRIIPFRPEVLMSDEACKIDQQKLKRWAMLLGVTKLNSNNTTLCMDILSNVRLLLLMGVLFFFQPSALPGQDPRTLPDPTPLTDLECQKVIDFLDLRPQFKYNQAIMKLALKNQVTLTGFYLEKYIEDFRKKAPKIKNGKPLKGLKWQKWKRADGPRILVSEDGYILFLYIPCYLTEENISRVCTGLTRFTALVPPKPDKGSGDSRAHQSTSTSQTSSTKNDTSEANEALWDNWIASHDRVDAASLHQCLAWIARGQAGHRNPTTSSELKAAFLKTKQPEALAQLMQYHLWKHHVDLSINDLIRRLHPEFHNLMADLRGRLHASQIPPPVIWEVWGSIFSFQSVGFNRQTEMHRDSAGMEGGLDVLFLVGQFKGGNLRLQDLALEVEWLPGDLCAFDGKLFSHGIDCWIGKSREVFIYFVHANVLRHFHMKDSLPFPTLADFKARVERAKDKKTI